MFHGASTMTRTPITALALATLLSMSALPATAQQTKPAPPAAATAATAPEPGSDAWLRQRSETYRSGPDSPQDPKEQAVTSQLNATIAANNAQADQTDADNAARHAEETAQWRAERDRIEAENAREAAAYA